MPHRHQRKLNRGEKSVHGHQRKKSEESQAYQFSKVPRGLILTASRGPPKSHCTQVCAGFVAPASRRLGFGFLKLQRAGETPALRNRIVGRPTPRITAFSCIGQPIVINYFPF
jgi:hypothetical protein